MVIFITSVRRDRLGSSQTRELVQFKLPFPVLKLATAAAGVIKIQCVIWSRFWYLGGSRGLTKWVRLPHLQIGPRKQNTSVEICSPFSCRYLEEYQNFFCRLRAGKNYVVSCCSRLARRVYAFCTKSTRRVSRNTSSCL